MNLSTSIMIPTQMNDSEFSEFHSETKTIVDIDHCFNEKNRNSIDDSQRNDFNYKNETSSNESNFNNDQSDKSGFIVGLPIPQISDVKAWIIAQWKDDSNRHAFQLGTAVILSSILIVINPINNMFKNTFWVGISVAAILDTSLGGTLHFSIQRMVGSVLAAFLSVFISVITRLIFPKWEWPAIVFFSVLLFFQVFIIAKIKQRPSTAYAGNVGLTTTIIILLSSYPTIVYNDILGVLRLALWRIFDLFIGIIIALLVSMCIFPSKAKYTLRKNLSKALTEAANLYEEMAGSYLYSIHYTSIISSNIDSTTKDNQNSVQLHSCAFSCTECIEEANQKALSVLARLHKESARLPNVSKEYYFTMPTRLLFGSRRKQWKRELGQTKSYNNVLNAINQIILACLSFRMITPSVKTGSNKEKRESAHKTCESSTSKNSHQCQKPQHITESEIVKHSFFDSLKVIRQLSNMLRDGNQNLSEHPDWPVVQLTILRGSIYIERGLAQTQQKQSNERLDKKGLEDHGFMIRCLTIWQSLEIIVEELCHHEACYNVQANSDDTIV